jgi:uncharacterized membrane protein YeaQ/YmgE (transglycosylase-associated protein family)
MRHQLLSTLAYFIMEQFQEHKMLIIAIVIGMVAGLIAQMVLPGRGFGMLATMAIGIAGSWLGNTFLLGHMEFIHDHLFRRIAAAIVGALVLMLVINLIRGGGDNDKTHWRTGS